jgi:enoyl-CoA hydratase/carnithine racemase
MPFPRDVACDPLFGHRRSVSKDVRAVGSAATAQGVLGRRGHRRFRDRAQRHRNARAYDDLVEDSCQLIEAIARPTIAVIIGFAWSRRPLAASCDLRIAADNAFPVPAARLGFGQIRVGSSASRVFGASARAN